MFPVPIIEIFMSSSLGAELNQFARTRGEVFQVYETKRRPDEILARQRSAAGGGYSGKNLCLRLTASTACRNTAAAWSLQTNPYAPADIATFRILVPSCMDSRRTEESGRRSRISRVALKPSTTGMVISMMTRSGLSSRAFSIASSPLPASPQTSTSSRVCTIAQTPFRTAA